MIKIDLRGKIALITGGTKGIGLASALELGKAGVKCYLTHKWGSADEDELTQKFIDIGAQPPSFIQADVSVEDDTNTALEIIAADGNIIDIFISNVGFALKVNELEDYKKRSLYKTLDYSSWPLIDYTVKMKKKFGKYPSRILAISSDGPDHYYKGYDFVAASKALLEFFSKYLAARLLPEGCKVNTIRFGTVKTESFSAIFGEDFFEYMKNNGLTEDMFLTPEDCGKTVFAFCSGYLDAINGQIISADFGYPFKDNSMMKYISSKE